MIIKDIRLINFGKFHDKEIHFEKGMNVIYGENEAGKTTIHTFIRGMLFGIDKQRGKASNKDIYTKYEPWHNPENYKGMMRVENKGVSYRFERNFNKNNKSFKVVNEDEGVELTSEEIEKLFHGLNENCYYNTISISQLGSATDGELESILKNYAANLGATKSMEINMKQALVELDTNRKKIISDSKVGAKESVIREIRDITDELDIIQQEKKNIVDNIEESRKKALEFNENKKELAAKDALRLEELTKHNAKKESLYQDIMNNNQEVEKFTKTLTEIVQQRTDLEHQLDIRGIPTREDMERVSSAISTATNIPIVSLILMMTCLGCAAGFYLSDPYIEVTDILSNLKLFIPVVGAIVCFIASIGRYFYKRERKRRVFENIRDIKLLLDKLDATKHEEVYVQRQKKAREQNVETIKNALDLLEEEELKGQNFSDEINKIDEDYRQIQEEVSKKQWMLEQRQEKEIDLKKNVEILKERLSVIVNAEIEIKALENAKFEIEEIANEVRNSFGKKLNERASYYMAQITNGKYDNLTIDDSLNISVNGKFALIPSSKLSKGTVEQIYMALRLAAADIIFENDKKPLLLDDAFVMYDNKRMGNTMKFMAEKLDQVIIFSCHTREKVMADKLGIDYQLKKL